jgi:trehalose 6-phosphate synthase
MRSALRFIFFLVVGLAILTWVAYDALTRTNRSWIESDLVLRSRLAIAVAHPTFVDQLKRGKSREMNALLKDIARDSGILAAAVCSPNGELLAHTENYPEQLTCRDLQAHSGRNGASPNEPWWMVTKVPTGSLHVSAIPILDGTQPLGTAILVHDLSFLERREADTRKGVLVAFAVLALSASFVTLLAARLAWRNWTLEMRRVLQGISHPQEFRPLLRDMRALVDRVISERQVERREALWTPGRLKRTLQQYLHGERIVILANREPYIHERQNGKVHLLHPASGLVTALEPVMRACSGVWVAHGSGSADRETSDSKGRLRVPPGEESYVLRRVWLSSEEEQGYYYGFANEGLWPLCHLADARPVFRGQDWQQYVHVNRLFAEVVCSEVDSDESIILVQDYHFALAPEMIRRRLPRATILTFWHVPWPNSERFGICPWREEVLNGLLGSSILGFQTQLHCNNFLDSVDAYMESRIDREENAVVLGDVRTFVRPYPISIEGPKGAGHGTDGHEESRRAVIAELNLPDDVLIGVGVDRIDYTKGIEERILSVERFLERFPKYRGRFVFIQLGAPSRTIIPRYQELNESVARLVEQVNTRFGTDSYHPIIFLCAHHEQDAIQRYYHAADVCYVSSLHDGMNLVAKEFVAARDDEAGVLVLSQFTGAARELTEALVVNPYDLDEASSALDVALRMPKSEQRDRMRFMRSLLSEFNVYRWAGRMIVDAAQLRRRERLSHRLRRKLLPAETVK